MQPSKRKLSSVKWTVWRATTSNKTFRVISNSLGNLCAVEFDTGEEHAIRNIPLYCCAALLMF